MAVINTKLLSDFLEISEKVQQELKDVHSHIDNDLANDVSVIALRVTRDHVIEANKRVEYVLKLWADMPLEIFEDQTEEATR